MTFHARLLAAALAVASFSAEALPKYSLFDLGALDASAIAGARINDAGQVLGRRGADAAFLYTPGAGLADLAALTGLAAGSPVTGVDLNNAGHVLGSAAGISFVYRPATGTQTLPEMYGVKRLNDAGQWIGEGYDGSSGFGYRYTPGTGYEELPLYGVLADINNQGQVAGVADYNETMSIDQAARFGDSGVQLLGSLGGNYSRSAAINNLGDVVGYGATTSAVQHAFLYTDGGGMVDLDPLGFASRANAINDHGLVGGSFWTVEDGPQRAFISDGASGLVDLNTLLDPAVAASWTILSVEDINNAGQIVGTGLYNGVSRAFVLSTVSAPVPEPAAWALLLAGAPLLAWGRRRAARRAGPPQQAFAVMASHRARQAAANARMMRP